MRSKTRQRLIKEENEYEMNKPSYEDDELETNKFYYGYAMTNKELIKYLDELILVNENDEDCVYTERDVPPNEVTYTKNDIRVDENGKKNIFTQMKVIKLLEVKLSRSCFIR